MSMREVTESEIIDAVGKGWVFNRVNGGEVRILAVDGTCPDEPIIYEVKGSGAYDASMEDALGRFCKPKKRYRVAVRIRGLDSAMVATLPDPRTPFNKADYLGSAWVTEGEFPTEDD